MSLYKDVAVKYINSTNHTEFSVIVSTTNYSNDATNDTMDAWKVLRAQTSSQFVYPVALSVAASYRSEGQLITAGPFPADPGSTWNILQELQTDTAILSQDMQAKPNPDNSVVVRNIQPPSWSGRFFDCHIYKDNRSIVTQADVRADDNAVFEIKPILFFGVTSNIQVGASFSSKEIMSAPFEVDLSGFPNGAEITLHESPGGGRYFFTDESLM